MGLSVAEKIRLIMKRQKITMGDLAEASLPLCQQVSLFMPGAEIVQRRMDRCSPPTEYLSTCNTGG